MDITVSGLSPALSGDDWFVLDESGEFTLDTTVMAEIWLVGGGMDGTDGFTDSKGIIHGGIGGQGGNVYKFGKVKLSKDTKYEVVIADDNIFVICPVVYDEQEKSDVVKYDKAEIYANQSSINTLEELRFKKWKS